MTASAAPKTAKNNTYTLTVGSPLLRPGLTLTTTTSEKYVVSAAHKLMELAR